MRERVFAQKHPHYATLTAAILLSLSTCLHIAYGQEPQKPDTKQKANVNITTTWTSEETTDWGYDRKRSRSRVGMSNNVQLPGKARTLKSTTNISQLIDIKQTQPKLRCESDIDVEYFQKNEETEVRTLFSSQNCDDYEATYQLRISYYDANRELRTIRSEEEWPAGRTEPLRKTFQIESGSELRRVTSHIISCVCDGPQ